MHVRRTLSLLSLLIFLSLALAPTTAAHASANSSDGKVRVTWGFQDEPGFTGQKLRMDIIVRDAATMAGIGDIPAADITELSLHYGEEEYDLGNLTAFRGAKGASFAGPGNYTAQNTVWLTRPGFYVLHIKGTIAGSEIDLEIPSAHEYPSHEEIAFPRLPEDDVEDRIAALETEVAALKAQIATQSTTPATLTPQTTPAGDDVPTLGLVLVALAIAGAALVLRRR